MRSRSRGETAVAIEKARLQFERWRKNRKKVTRIPDRLWAAAVAAARLHGVNPTATALGLDYKHLKERTRSVRGSQRKRATSASFMELIVPPERSPVPGCTIEVENVRGAKMKIQLQNVEMNELAACIQRFWSEPR